MNEDDHPFFVFFNVPCPYCGTVQQQKVNLKHISDKNLTTLRLTKCDSEEGCQNRFAVRIELSPVIKTSLLNWDGR